MTRADKEEWLIAKCRNFPSCYWCPVYSNEKLKQMCHVLPFDSMTEEQLDRLISYFESAEQPVDSTGYDKVQRHKELCDKIHSLYKKKNHDYGDSFCRSDPHGG